MPARRQTKSGRLSDVARHVVMPSGIVSTGWPAVRDTAKGFGYTYDPWQADACRGMLAKRKSGAYAASIGGVVLSIPRQVGKTSMMCATVFALCLLFPGLTVLWTAHRLKTAQETFSAMQSFAARSKVKPHIEAIVLGSGDQAIKFRNGSRILFGARERGFGRGFADVDVEVFDEAQILGDNALDDMVPAMNTAANPLAIFIGTPPKPSDPSEFFTRKRTEALKGTSKDTMFVEFSADTSADPDDRKQWAKANPSYPKRTPAASMLRMRELLANEESFLREGLGIWDEEDANWVIPADDWERAEQPDSRIDGAQTFALEVSEDRDWSAIAAAGQSTLDGMVHGEVIAYEEGTGWCVARAKALTAKWGGEVAIVKGSPAASLMPALKKAKVPTREVTTAEHAAACGQLYDACTSDPVQFAHPKQAHLTVALRGAVKKDNGDGAWVWSRKRSAVDISPLVAVTVAAALVETQQKARFVDLSTY